MPRYEDLTLNSGEYIPQYAGVPLEEVRRTADTLSERHYQNLAKLNQLQLVAEQYKSKMLPGAKSYVDTHINDISVALQDLAANGGEHATARVAAIGNRFLGDQGILAGLQTAEAVNKEIEIENRLLAENKMPIRKRGVRESVMNSPIYDPASGQLASPYSSPYLSTVTQYEDPTPHMEKIWDIVKPDSIEGELKAADGLTLRKLLGDSMAGGVPDLPMFFESLTRAGIGRGKIDAMLNNAWSSYQQTPAYKQAIDYADDKSVERKKQKDQFYKHGLLRVFDNIQRQYMPTGIADDLLRMGAQKPQAQPIVTQAPGNVVETLFPYDVRDYAVIASGGPEHLERLIEANRASDVGGYAAKKSPQEIERQNKALEQYNKDWRTMADIKGGTKDIAENSDQARSYAKEYRDMVERRVSNPYVTVLSHDEGLDKNYEIQSQFGLYTYMDPITGEVFTPFDKNGKPTDEFVEKTGGDPTKFRVESVYDAKNHYSSVPGSSNKFTKPIGVVSEDKDGNQKRFLVSQLPANTSPFDINTNVIYNKVNLRPGQMVDVTPRVKARELHGRQYEDIKGSLTPEQQSAVTLPIEATVDGETLLFLSPEHLSEYLISKGINLSN